MVKLKSNDLATSVVALASEKPCCGLALTRLEVIGRMDGWLSAEGGGAASKMRQLTCPSLRGGVRPALCAAEAVARRSRLLLARWSLPGSYMRFVLPVAGAFLVLIH